VHGERSRVETAEKCAKARLRATIEEAAHLLPEQGPITVFIHHNTLHAFEYLPFEQGVVEGARTFRCQPYLSESEYREELRRGRIRFEELQEVLLNDLGEAAHERVAPRSTRFDVRLAMLQYPLHTGSAQELIWHVAEADALRRVRPETSSATRAQLIAETRHWVMRDLRAALANGSQGQGARASVPPHVASGGVTSLLRGIDGATLENWTESEWESFALRALWRVCCDGVAALPALDHDPRRIRHRDLLWEAVGEDSDQLVNEALIPFCAAFLDQGLGHWDLPHREEGFYEAFVQLYRQRGQLPRRWQRGLRAELERLARNAVSPLDAILQSLDKLGVPEEEWERFISHTFLAMPGWAGMIRQVELRGDRVARPIPGGSLIGYLAVRLVLEVFALQHLAAEEFGFKGSLTQLRQALKQHRRAQVRPSDEQRAFAIFQLAQLLGYSPDMLCGIGTDGWATLVSEIESFHELDRRRIYHLAFEHRFTRRTLDAVALHQRRLAPRQEAPRFQLICCIDEREESLRRHVEEVAPDAETFGAAGFFSVPMYYRGAADAYYVPLCPIIIRPDHWVAERVLEEHGAVHERRNRRRKALGAATHHFHVGSRSFALGAILTAAFGVLATIPLVARILLPRIAARIRSRASRIVETPRATKLTIERVDGSPVGSQDHLGFTVDEMTNATERLLRDLGLTRGFAPLVILLGHGSRSLNNPHNSAYNCGACGGSAGGPNARAVALMLNDPRVRDGLKSRGIVIPTGTHFVGGSHNTCNDTVVFYETDSVPPARSSEFERVQQELIEACARNAHERCRRFVSAPLSISKQDAQEHVEERAEDLAQTRPELGHATNAITFVGRRAATRGLFLDRRAFLTSYDASQDDDQGTILGRILQAVIPVCAGINLEYYFSRVDNHSLGAGTKLPHNLSSLLGVMDGAASDLRTGLPWQMVEIHEPVRSVFVIETTPAVMLGLIEQNAMIARMCRNQWVRLAVLHPRTGEVFLYNGEDFRLYEPQAQELPQASSSLDWYQGWRDHLEFAEINSSAGSSG
jgi:uncharacterized protein YbcC (UPF0753/DUF2309 family)